jgi:hypothetical protein
MPVNPVAFRKSWMKQSRNRLVLRERAECILPFRNHEFVVTEMRAAGGDVAVDRGFATASRIGAAGR